MTTTRGTLAAAVRGGVAALKCDASVEALDAAADAARAAYAAAASAIPPRSDVAVKGAAVEGPAAASRLSDGSAASFDALRAAQTAHAHLAAKAAALEVRRRVLSEINTSFAHLSRASISPLLVSQLMPLGDKNSLGAKACLYPGQTTKMPRETLTTESNPNTRRITEQADAARLRRLPPTGTPRSLL